jgi:hypothetical protein
MRLNNGGKMKAKAEAERWKPWGVSKKAITLGQLEEKELKGGPDIL